MGISVWQLLIVLAIVVLLFGTKRLKSIGSDLGGAIKGFKKAVDDDEQKNQQGDADFTEHQKVDNKNKTASTTTTQSDVKEKS
ncbi:Sec-independent protein translocase subunit TatA [Salinimonas chungwhensis]|uniref:Sec-independent protein translocase subunit TatA n=1 Tax=Salinimonas chungwhensis TaxID=265425 RepID=UPI0003802697|nr:Sec-independent protein translocase subunit TatA [Salinimonas chungwhensis]